MDLALPIVSAFWFGILTSISPCPLATNIAAISFVGYRISSKPAVLLSGILYTIGRCITYSALGFLITEAVVNVPLLSDLMQRYINKVLGILLILVGMFLLDLLKVHLPSLSPSEKVQRKLDEAGILGSLFLGVLFALAFCPVSAALFFGSLIPLAITAKSSVVLPSTYGVGTGLPVLVFAVLIALGAGQFNAIYRRVTQVEYYGKKITGVVFVLVGIYYVLAYIFGIL